MTAIRNVQQQQKQQTHTQTQSNQSINIKYCPKLIKKIKLQIVYMNTLYIPIILVLSLSHSLLHYVMYMSAYVYVYECVVYSSL